MTIDEQRITVLEWMGWKLELIHSDHGWDDWSTTNPQGKWLGAFNMTGLNTVLPPLTLDWVHEAWMKLSPAQKVVYAEALVAITLAKGDMIDWGYYPGETTIDWDAVSQVVGATKEQRLAALVETIKEK